MTPPLGAYTTHRREFSQDDVNLMRAVGNALAAAMRDRRAEQAWTTPSLAFASSSPPS